MPFLDVFRRPAAVAALLAGAAMCVSGDAAAPKVTGWHRDLRTAETEARRLNLPLLVHFYADWCGPCKKMESEVLSSPDLMRQLGTQVVGAKLNLDENDAVAKTYGVTRLPSDVIVAPDGRVLAHTIGYQSERDYLGRLAKISAEYTQSQKFQIANDATSKANPGDKLHPIRNRDSGNVKPVSDPQPRSGEAAFIGLNGYSPVALFHKRDWIKGNRDYTAAFEGVIYQFTSAEELKQFESEPEKFAPRLLGCDPVVLSETERAIPGSTRFGAYFDGRLFLFVSSATRDQFRQTPERYGKVQDTIKVEQIEYRRGP